MGLIENKIAALQTILPTIDSGKATDLQNLLAWKSAGKVTDAQLATKVADFETFVDKFYGLLETAPTTPQTPIDETDISEVEEFGFTVEDGIEGHYNLKRYGEVVFQISKTIGKTDFHNIVNTNKIQRIIPQTQTVQE